MVPRSDIVSLATREMTYTVSDDVECCTGVQKAVGLARLGVLGISLAMSLLPPLSCVLSPICQVLSPTSAQSYILSQPYNTSLP